MKNLKSWIVVLIGILLMIVITHQCTQIKDLKSEMKLSSQKTDTVKIPVPYKIPDPYFEELNPEVVTIYKKDTVTQYPLFKLKGKDIMLVGDKDSLVVAGNYLNTFVLHDKLLHLGLTKKKLSLSTLGIDGVTQTRTYPIDLDEYNYSYSTKLTYKKIHNFSIKPSLEYSYRPFNNFHDIDMMLNFKTKKFNYKLGLNGFYYPSLKQNPGWDVKISLSYNF